MSGLNPMSGETLDLIKENIDKLKELFPEILTEDQIDFEKLRLILGDNVNHKPERYSFTWNGKQNAIKLAQQPSTGTLRPNLEKSKNWDSTENLYIEGDNLEVLKVLQKSYSNKIKVMYFDPPYNTGKDFIYKDSFKDSISNYFEQTGQVDEEGNKFSTNNESDGRYHTNWLNMLFPRLILSKNLLTDDGVIFISIDDVEVANLKKMCNEIFGENNFIAQIIVDATPKNDPLLVATSHEYVLVYVKNKEVAKRIEWGKIHPLNIKLNELVHGLSKEEAEIKLAEFYTSNKLKKDNISNYKFFDEQGIYRTGPLDDPQSNGPKDKRLNLKTGEYLKIPAGGWRTNIETWNEWVEQGLIEFPDSDDKLASKKTYLNTSKLEVGRSVVKVQTRKSTNHLKNLFDGKEVFSYPKPISLISHLIEITNDKNSIVLDAFAGSGTTAEAVLRLNAKDGGNRKFIMIQLPENLEDNYDNATGKSKRVLKNAIEFLNKNNQPLHLTEISEERIRRAGEKLIGEKSKLTGKLDIGFKVLELDKSNIKKWNIESDDLSESLFEMENNFIENRSHLDIVYEMFLKQGLDLNTPFEKQVVGETTIFDVACGNVYIILGENITHDVATYISEKQKHYENENPSVIFNDIGFVNDDEKLNIIEVLKNNGFNEEQLMSI